ncbi:hypothetical protein FGB62_52g19 [Gracilaria domingensis]|nr:hypothetical protein FGB62_52g19 [Gracilaria domingensis]
MRTRESEKETIVLQGATKSGGTREAPLAPGVGGPSSRGEGDWGVVFAEHFGGEEVGDEDEHCACVSGDGGECAAAAGGRNVMLAFWRWSAGTVVTSSTDGDDE